MRPRIKGTRFSLDENKPALYPYNPLKEDAKPFQMVAMDLIVKLPTIKWVMTQF